MMSRLSFWLPLLTLLFFLGVWQSLVVLESGHGSNLPSPMEVFQALGSAEVKEFWPDLVSSIFRLVPGLILGTVLGVGAGIVGGRNPLLRMTAGPLLHAWRALPAVALAPLFVQLLGINEYAKITVITIGVFFPVWVATQDGAASLSPDLLDLGRTLELSWKAVYWRIVLPWTLPFAVAGIRIGIGSGYAMLFFSEWLGATSGVGYRASMANTTGRIDLMIFSLMELGLMAFLTDLAFFRAVQAAAPWVRYARS